MIRTDLHVHSTGSYDSLLGIKELRKALKSSLDIVAITDHNNLDKATEIQQSLGSDKIIVGEEINTDVGEIIGLYLSKVIKPGQPVRKTAELIKEQGGLVYVPHPFESMQRHGLKQDALDQIIDLIDIFETYNARTLSLLSRARAVRFARANNLVQASGSDAHGPSGLGSAMRLLEETPTKDTLIELLRKSRPRIRPTTIKALLEPSRSRRNRAKISRIKRKR